MAWAEQGHEPAQTVEIELAEVQLRIDSLAPTWEARCRVTVVEKRTPRLALTHITACEMGVSDLREALASLTEIVSQQTVEVVLGADLDPMQVHDGQGPSVVFRLHSDGRHFLLPTLGDGAGERFIPADPGLDCQEWAANLETVCQAARDMERALHAQLETAGAEGDGPAVLTESLPNWSVRWEGAHPLGFEARSYCGLWECGALITLTHRFASLSQPTPFAQFYCSVADLDASVAELRRGQYVLYGRPAPWSPTAQKEEEQ